MAELEALCLQARTLKNSACVSIIQRAISHKKIFFFGELLDECNIRALEGTEFEKALNTLKLFSYSTYEAYLSIIINRRISIFRTNLHFLRVNLKQKPRMNFLN
jgi:hypothetical protein